jgi:hypothetical protein
VRYAAMERYSAKDVILARPSSSADTVATLDGASLCFTHPRRCVRSFQRMVEFAYEIPGWAIVDFSADSTWVQVTLNPSEPPGVLGWVRLRPDSVEALLWPVLLHRQRLFFLRAADIGFYSLPDGDSRVVRRLAKRPNSEELDYIMRPLEARGPWLRVQLFSPSNYCTWPEIKVTPDTLWVQYLTSDLRPRVFYYSRGC